MGIQLSGVPEAPALVYNNAHMLSKCVTHPKKEVDAHPSVFRLQIEYQLYAVDADGKRHYEPLVREIVIQNFLEHAMLEMAEGNPVYVQALIGDEAAIAALIAADCGVDTTVT